MFFCLFVFVYFLATSNETTPASVEFAMSLAKLTKHNLKENTSDIAFENNILPLKMLSTLAPTTPSTTRESSSVSSLLFTPTTNSNVGLEIASSYRTNSGRQNTLDESSKYKRAAVADNSAQSLCDKFSKVNAASRQLYSPNYPDLYPNKSNCVVVLEG